MNRTTFFLGLSGLVVTLGAIEAAATGSTTVAAALGGAALTGASTVAQDLLKDRIKSWVKSPPEDPGKLFANGHLTQLIAEAIQAVLTRERDDSVGSFRVQLDQLIKPVVSYWQEHFPKLTDGSLEEAHAANLTEVLHRQIQAKEDFPLATVEAWEGFLSDYAREQQVGLEAEPRRRAAERLHRELGNVLYEKAKQAAVTNPRAAAAIQLQFQSWLRRDIAELHKSVRDGFADQARKLVALQTEISGESPLPPLVDRLRLEEAPGEFIQLIDALLVREGRRDGWNYPASKRITSNTTGVGTPIYEGSPFGFKSPTWISIECRIRTGVLGPAFPNSKKRPIHSIKPNRVVAWIVVSPIRLDEAEWEETVTDADLAGTTTRNYTQPEFEPWLRRCPPLLARYYPEVAVRRPDAQGFDGRPFEEWRREFAEKVLADHRNLHLFGFPRRPQAPNDPANDPNTFLLEQVFIPQKLVLRGTGITKTRTAGELIQDGDCLVLLGDPGAGKTSLLRYLAVVCGEGREISGVKCGPRVPLFLPLREFVRGRKERPTLLEALAWQCRKAASLQASEVHPWRIEALLLMGEAQVFFDGLDEAGDHHSRREIARLIQGFHEEYPDSPVWVTSRIVGYDRASLDKEQFTHFEVTPFDPKQQAAFVRQWYLAKLPRPETGTLREQKSAEFLGSLEKAVPEIRELACNPLLLTLAIWVHDEIGYLPPGRGQLYDHCVELLIHKRDSARFGEEKSSLQLLTPPVSSADLRHYYADIALKAQELNAGGKREARGIIPKADLLRWIASRRERDIQRHYDTKDSYPAQAEEDALAILDFSEERCGLLRFRGDDTYGFLHLSFQEHLAAERKASSLAGKPTELARFIAEHVERDAWRETLLLLLHHLRNKQVRDEADDEREVPFSHWLVARLKAPGQPALSPAYQRLLGMALRDGIKFSPAHCRWILEQLVANWRNQPVFDSETFQVLAQVAGFSPESQPELRRLLEAAWQREAGLDALLVLHLRIRLVGWPGDSVEGARLASELATRLGGLESPPSRERGLSSPPEQLRQMLRAAELLGDADPEAVSATTEGAQCVALVRESLLAAMWNPQLEVKERAGAGTALARIGDPRPGVMPKAPFTLENPLFAWCALKAPGPAGFKMGGGRERFDCTRLRQDFRMARYPVTVAQYALFVAEGGYGDLNAEPPAWWAATGEWTGFAGWDWLKQEQVTGPVNFSDPAFQTPNHPRIGVSWFEAVAFCRWLNQRFTTEQLGLPAGWRVRLPSEAEWEYAASAGGTRRYPWDGGEDWSNRCNCAATNLRQTSAVGLFPQGRAECGAEDLAGNVWEWGSSRWQDSYSGYNDLSADELEGTSGSDDRVIRGGTWIDYADDVRTSCRRRYLPGGRINFVGFRLAASPIPLNSGPSVL